jgi:CheY-like chemotaxis protein
VGCVVLLVDDDAAFRGLAARILTSWGHEVVEAGSVEETLELAAERHPGVAVVDVGLADGNGFTLTRQLVSPPFSLRVVLISTEPAAGNATASRRAGAQAFVPKDQLLTGDLRRLLDDDRTTGGPPHEGRRAGC